MGKLFADLRRRRVFRVAAVYAVVAWLLIQVVTAIETPLSLPDWFDTIVIVLLAIGFPLAILFAWVFDLTPDGIKITGTDSPVEFPQAGSTLDYALGALLLVVLGFMTAQQFDLFDAEEGIETTVGTDQVAETPALVEEPASPTIESSTPIDNMSIAVLVLRNESPDPDNEYFAAGIHEAILNQLAKISALQVKSRTTVLRYADSDLNTVEIARELGVGSVMEGSVRFAGNDVRISLQLIDAMDDVHLWSDEYTREFEEIFAIESDVAIQVANAMQATLLPLELARIERPATDSTEAYNLFLRTMYQREQEARGLPLVEGGYWEAGIRRLERAIELDPLFARGIAELAQLKYTKGLYTVSLDERTDLHDEARMHANKAVEIDPTIPRSYAVLAQLSFQAREWDEWLSYGRQAVALPDLDGQATSRFAYTLLQIGQYEEAWRWYAVALSKDTQSTFFLWTYIASRIHGGDYETAIELTEQFLTVGGSENDYHAYRAYALNRLGREAESLNELSEISAQPTTISASWFHTQMRCQSGEQDNVLDELGDRVAFYPRVYCAAGVGDVDTIFEIFQQQRDRGENIFPGELDFDIIKSDPRWQEVEEYMNIPDLN